MTRYINGYIDYIRYFSREIAAKSYLDRKYIQISMLCLDYFEEVTKMVSNYTYDDLWNCPNTDNLPFYQFYERYKNDPLSELEKTVVTFMHENQHLLQTYE
jgi:hypothetical protein